MKEVKTKDGAQVFVELGAKFIAELSSYFDIDPSKTSRLEQFYALMYVIGREMGRMQISELDLDPISAQKVLKASRVFPTDDLISNITAARIDWHHRTRQVEWRVDLALPELEIPLNEGNGFKAFQHGVCQQVQKLVLYGGFDALIEQTQDNNILVKFKNPVDFVGHFGSRGVVDVDVNFVSLFEIEFHRGSKLGTSKVRISKREFQQTSHPWWLRMVSRMVSESTTQPIDW